MDAEHQAFVLQVAQGLAHRDAADAEGRHHFALGRHLLMGLVGAIEHTSAQDFLDLLVQRRGRRWLNLVHRTGQRQIRDDST
ncbi:hypothetical protein D9M68_873780 [compost metagenome]